MCSGFQDGCILLSSDRMHIVETPSERPLSLSSSRKALSACTTCWEGARRIVTMEHCKACQCYTFRAFFSIQKMCCCQLGRSLEPLTHLHVSVMACWVQACVATSKTIVAR